MAWDTVAEDAPLTGADLDRWTAGLDAVVAAVARVVAGVDEEDLAAWLAAPTDGAPAFLTWRLPRERLDSDPAGWITRDPERLAWPFDADRPARFQPPPARLAVTGNVIPAEVVPRLLACPGLAAAVMPVGRAAGALRRRAWHWPLRIGVLEDELRDVFDQLRGYEGVPEPLVDVSDLRTDPGGVDLVVLRGTPAEAAARLGERRQLANAVVCVGEPGGAWPVVDAQLTLIRAVTGAIVTALAPPDGAEGVVRHVLRTLRHLAHAHPFDVALTAGFDRTVLITGELAALAASDLPTVIRRRARQLRLDLEELTAMAEAVGAEPPEDLTGGEPEPGPGRGEGGGDRGLPVPPAPPPPPRVRRITRAEPPLAELEALPQEGAFAGESHEASRVPDLTAEVESVLAEAAVPRFLQARVTPVAGAEGAAGAGGGEGAGGAEGAGGGNVLRPGPNAVDVFIGPEERGALVGPESPDRELFADPTLEMVRLTVVLAPLLPPGEPVRAELEVPRVGRSPNARLLWTLPARGRVQARLMVLHRNRVIQTALLSGHVGRPAELRERLVLWESFAHLDDRQPFDRTFVLNHDDDGTPAVVTHADGATRIAAMDEIEAITDRIRRLLLRATHLRSTTSKAAVEEARTILVDVAGQGNDLYVLLEDHLGRLGDARRIQIVTARSGRFLPLEMVYDRRAPAPEAKVCENWLAGRECGPHCFSSPKDRSVVCPAVFWGMGRVIERHHTSLAGADGTAFLVTANPTRERRRLTITRALLAASDKVDPADVDTAKAVLRVAAQRVESWDDWVGALAGAPTDLLLLMPHTDPAQPSLEISGRPPLRREYIEWEHVTGERPDVHPIVVLFGCDTGGSEEDPAGYATRFMARGAAAVFSTLTMLLNTHAAAMSQQLAALLMDPERGEVPLGELVARFRRDAVRAGLVAALSVTAYGDADWKV